jgi:Uma2 family endonuclease
MQLLETQPLLLDVHRITLRVTHAEFEKLCQDNPDLRLELTANGELIAMVPVALESSEQNGDLFGEVWAWNRQTKLGRVFDSSGGFTLPNGAVRSPDVTWIGKPKAAQLLPGITFPELVPDFVIELRSKSDSLKTLREKMDEYRFSRGEASPTNGVRLGLLINPKNKQVEIYRLGQEISILESPTSIDCSEVMPGFILNLSEIW